MTHRYDHMSSWTAKKPFLRSTESDLRDLRDPEELGKQLSVLRQKQSKKQFSKLHDVLEDVLSR